MTKLHKTTTTLFLAAALLLSGCAEQNHIPAPGTDANSSSDSNFSDSTVTSNSNSTSTDSETSVSSDNPESSSDSESEPDLQTLTVVGHGLEQIYPTANERLAQEIIDQGGAVITEMPSGTQIIGGLFPRRNRIIAGLSQAVVVAEASIKGGALITARIAHSYNRNLFAFPGRNDMPYSKGCNFLIKTQMAQLLETAGDLRAETAWTWGEPAKPKAAKPTPRTSAPPAHLDDTQRVLLKIIQRENPADIELLAAETGRPLPDLLNDLLALELAGCIRTVPGNRYEAV